MRGEWKIVEFPRGEEERILVVEEETTVHDLH